MGVKDQGEKAIRFKKKKRNVKRMRKRNNEQVPEGCLQSEGGKVGENIEFG